MLTRMVARGLASIAGAVLVLVMGLASEASASPTRQWLDGSPAYTSHNECIFHAAEYLTGHYVGYYGNTDVTFPRVGDIYYAHVVASTLGNPCAGPYVHLEVGLPRSTAFAISAGFPVYCFYTNPQGQTSQNTANCPQTMTASKLGNAGYFNLDPVNDPSNTLWPLAQGAFIEVQFPVRSLVPLSGIATNDWMYSIINAIDGAGNPIQSAQQGIFVGAKPPGSKLGQGGVDFDWDLTSDVAVYNPPSGLWYIRPSTTTTTYSVGYGGTGYVPVAADYDLDGKADIAVYHSASGLWFVKPSSGGPNFTLAFGGAEYTPVPADYDWDGRADFAVYHRPTGLWYVQQSTTLTTVTYTLGGTGYDPVPKDYDGDGKTDIAVYNPTTGQWSIRQSSTGTLFNFTFGGTGFLAVPRDYDGDGKADIAVYHPPSGLWYIRQSSTGTTVTVGYGGTGYNPVPADYDGDGKADIAVYHQASGLWFIKRSSAGGATFSVAFGGSAFPPIN